MGIKVTTVENKIPNEEEYPRLKKFVSKDFWRIVFFSEPGKGQCVDSADCYDIGTIGAMWSEENYKPFNGTVTLEND